MILVDKQDADEENFPNQELGTQRPLIKLLIDVQSGELDGVDAIDSIILLRVGAGKEIWPVIDLHTLMFSAFY